MRLFKEKLAWAAPIAVILIIALFSVNLFAQGNPQVKNLPVALIVNDEGVNVDAVKAAVEQMSKGVDGAEPLLAFTTEKQEDIEDLFDDKEYYKKQMRDAKNNAKKHIDIQKEVNDKEIDSLNKEIQARTDYVDKVKAEIELTESQKQEY